MKRVFALGALALVCAAGGASAGQVSERTTYFMVRGATVDEMSRNFGAHGPLLGGGKRHGGATQITFKPTVTYRTASGGCAVDRADVRLDVVTTLPQWAVPAGATPQMNVEWRTLRDQVATHESRHAAIAKSWLPKMEKELRSLPPARDCEAMKRTVAATQRSLFAAHDRAQKDFDRVEARQIDKRLRKQLNKNMGQFVLRRTPG